MVWGAIAGAVAGGILSGRAAKKAGQAAAAGQQASIDEQRRQFDITQKQQKPWIDAGQNALGRYEEQLGNRQQNEDKIRSNIPQAFQSSTNIPQAYSGQSGNYFGNIQSNVQPGFQFGRAEFDQYKDPGYEFRREEGLRGLERGNAAGGKRTSGYNTRSLMELGQNLGSQEFGAARGRAMQDYQSGVNREQQNYGRSVGDYNRRVGRESELYGRGRQQRQDETGREAELYNRNLRDYGLGVQREQQQYGRDVSRYGREYIDPMNRELGLSNSGANMASNLGQQRGQFAGSIGGNMENIGGYNAAGRMGEAGAYAGAIGSIGGSLGGMFNSGDWSGQGSSYFDPSQIPSRTAAPPQAMPSVFDLGGGYGGESSYGFF